MTDPRSVFIDTVDFDERAPRVAFDFDHIQVAPSSSAEKEGFEALDLAERQALLKRLIDRVKSL